MSSLGLLSNSPPILCSFLGLPWPRCCTLNPDLLDFMRFLWALFSSLSCSLWMAACPSVVSAVAHSFVPSAVLLRLHLIPLSVISEDIEDHWSQIRALRDAAHHQPPPGYRGIEHKSLAASIQAVPFLPNSSHFKFMWLLFGDKSVLWSYVEGFTEVWLNYICKSHLVNCCCTCSEGH